MTFYDYLKYGFIILIIISIAPSLFENIKKQYGRILEPKALVGVVEIKGSISDSASYIKRLTAYFKNNEIKAILIKMDSEGGSAGSSYALYNEIMALKQEHPKPIITLVENICASGSYWAACSTDYIIAPAVALIGSIGATFPYLFQLREFLAQYKVNYISMKAGKYKNASNPFADITLEEQQHLQNLLNDTAQRFIASVTQARKLSLTKVAEWGEGQLFTGEQARALGLIDEIGSLSNAIKAIKEKALIEEEIEWVQPQKETGLLGWLTGQQNEAFMQSAIASLFTSAYKQALMVE